MDKMEEDGSLDGLAEVIMAPGCKDNPMPEATEEDKKAWVEMNKGRVVFGGDEDASGPRRHR